MLLAALVRRRTFAASAGLKHLSTAPIGFVGLGNMGSNMAANLAAKAGHPLLVYDAAPGRAEAVAKQCASTTAASSLAELAEACSIVVTMLPNTSHVEAVYTDADSGLLRWAKPDTLFIDSSTISPIASRAVASRAQAAGHSMIDAPVSGGVPAAQAGTLTFIVGGDAPAVQRATPLLQAMGRSIVHCGASGSGCIAKLANNLALAVSMVGICEAMNLGVKLGMEPKTLAHVLNTSTARCWSSDTYNPYPGVMEGVPSSRGYTGGFAAALMEKDLHLALQAGRESHSSLPMTALAHQLYSIMEGQGSSHKDFSAIFELIAGANASSAASGGSSSRPISK